MASRIARSIATQHMSWEYRNFLGPPRVSQMPSSGWSQWSQSQSARAMIVSHWALEMGWCQPS